MPHLCFAHNQPGNNRVHYSCFRPVSPRSNRFYILFFFFFGDSSVAPYFLSISKHHHHFFIYIPSLSISKNVRLGLISQLVL